MHLHFTIGEALQTRPKPLLAVIGVFLLCLVVLVDSVTPWEISVDVLYLLPIGYFSWYFSWAVSVLVALVSALAWLVIAEAQQPPSSIPGTPYWNALISLALFLLVARLLQEIRTLYTKERENSRSDFLTGIANRRAFTEILGAEIQRARRYDLITTLAYLDLDNFKQVNDLYGHKTGDNVLILIAQTLCSTLRNTDVPARLGGDEYSVLMPQTDAEAASLVLQKLQSLLNHKMEEHRWPITLSIGSVTYLRPPESVDEMFQQADKTMYAAKAAGKNRIVQTVFSEYAVQQPRKFATHR